uniref:Uncharacterized protein n=1 Tax=Minutocellus polymorphus TaxID=265543 RepID=A0A7S0FL12_9STRA|mmetsp:Transcript_17470/g.29065  ORF Transcript_17470/g.29065 Transcript_17470/m.29065 type:complete len:266 (+) Transcript_17470:347-1144(+)
MKADSTILFYSILFHGRFDSAAMNVPTPTPYAAVDNNDATPAPAPNSEPVFDLLPTRDLKKSYGSSSWSRPSGSRPSYSKPSGYYDDDVYRSRIEGQEECGVGCIIATSVLVGLFCVCICGFCGCVCFWYYKRGGREEMDRGTPSEEAFSRYAFQCLGKEHRFDNHLAHGTEPAKEADEERSTDDEERVLENKDTDTPTRTSASSDGYNICSNISPTIVQGEATIVQGDVFAVEVDVEDENAETATSTGGFMPGVFVPETNALKK